MSGIKHPSPPEQLIDHPGQRVHDRVTGVAAKDGGLRAPLDGFQALRREIRPVANCATGVIAHNNCNGDPYWHMPNGKWWNFPGIGGSSSNRNRGSVMRNNPNNPQNYDFAGGQRTSGAPSLPTVNQQVFTGGFVVVRETPLLRTEQRTWYNCNCGTNTAGTYNCYTNCNCNCDCDCNCNCNCDCETVCFLRGTPVLMVDGSEKPIEQVVRGDLVTGAFGYINEVRQTAVSRLGNHSMFLINGRFLVAGGHRIWVRSKGWACAEPADFLGELAADQRGQGARLGQPWITGIHVPESSVNKLEVGDDLAFGTDGTVIVETLSPVTFPPETELYELFIHNGSGSYTVYGGLWATGAPDYSFDFAGRVETRSQVQAEGSSCPML